MLLKWITLQMMLKKFYKFIILPYTIFLLYLMFFGMGRLQYDDNIVRIKPIVSTIWFIHETISWFDIIRIVLGNVVMFIPFGFLGWVFPQLKKLEKPHHHFCFCHCDHRSSAVFFKIGSLWCGWCFAEYFWCFSGIFDSEFFRKKIWKLC